MVQGEACASSATNLLRTNTLPDVCVHVKDLFPGSTLVLLLRQQLLERAGRRTSGKSKRHLEKRVRTLAQPIYPRSYHNLVIFIFRQLLFACLLVFGFFAVPISGGQVNRVGENFGFALFYCP